VCTHPPVPTGPTHQFACTRVMPSPSPSHCHVGLRSRESVSTSRHREDARHGETEPTRGGRERRSAPPWSRDERVLHGCRLGSGLRLGPHYSQSLFFFQFKLFLELWLEQCIATYIIFMLAGRISGFFFLISNVCFYNIMQDISFYNKAIDNYIMSSDIAIVIITCTYGLVNGYGVLASCIGNKM
jgi:hypothetical protein